MSVNSLTVKSERPANQDAVALLCNDHNLLAELFDLFDQTQDRRQMKVVARLICKLLSVHMAIEEQLVYPLAHRALKHDTSIFEAEVEHTAAKVLIAELESLKVADEKFAATLKVLNEYTRHHFNEEETVVFPQLAARTDMHALGHKLAARRLDLLATEGIAESELLNATLNKSRNRRSHHSKARTRTVVSLRHLVERLAAQRAREP